MNLRKCLLGSIFVSEQRFDCGAPDVRLTQMCSKFLVCLNGRPQKVDMSRLVQNSLRVCWNTTIQCCSQTVALRRHVFFERPLRQTRIFSDAFFSRTNTQPPLSKLERTTNHIESPVDIFCTIFTIAHQQYARFP